MTIANPTQLATIASSTGGLTTWSTGAIVFPTNGADVLGLIGFHVSGYTGAVGLGVTDNLGNTWTVIQVSQTLGAANQTACIAYFNYPSAGSNTTATVTIAFTSSNLRLGWCGYTTGHDPVTPFDLSDTDTQNTGGTSSPLATAGNLAVDGELVFVSWGAVGTAAPSTWPSTGFTSLTNVHDATRNRSGSVEYQVLGAGTAGAPAATTINYTPAGASTGVLATFRPAGASPPSNTAVPVVTGTAAVGSTLSSTTGTWTGSPTSYAYQWQRDGGTSGATWTDIAGATASTYAIPGDPNPADDVGSALRCKVTASNANGAGTPASSTATSVVAAPAGQISYRIVAGPLGQTDEQIHTNTLSKPVLAGDLLLMFAGCSNYNNTDGNGNKSDVGYVFDTNGNTWTEIAGAEEFNSFPASGLRTGQCFETHSASAMAVGDTVSINVHSIGTVPTTLAGTDPLAYHGQSPYWMVVAVSTGDTRVLNLDQASHNVVTSATQAAPSITMTNSVGLVIGFHVDANAGASAGWWTPTAGFVEIADTPQGTESTYNIASEVKTTSTGYTGGAGGTIGAARAVTNLVVAHSTANTVQTISVGQALETDLAQTITHGAKLIAVGQVVETNTAQPLGRLKVRTVVQTTETDTARPMVLPKKVAVATALETDTAQTITKSGGLPDPTVFYDIGTPNPAVFDRPKGVTE